MEGYVPRLHAANGLYIFGNLRPEDESMSHLYGLPPGRVFQSEWEKGDDEMDTFDLPADVIRLTVMCHFGMIYNRSMGTFKLQGDEDEGEAPEGFEISFLGDRRIPGRETYRTQCVCSLISAVMEDLCQ